VSPAPITIVLGTEPPGTVSTRLEPPDAVGAARMVRNVNVATITAFLPDGGGTGDAMLVCPGGGFHALAVDHEGESVAVALNALGIAAFVLEYRLLPTPLDQDEANVHVFTVLADVENIGGVLGEHDLLLREDALRAVATIRDRAQEWGVDPDRIGAIGFSAGGHVALSLARLTNLYAVAAIYPAVLDRDDLQVADDAPPLFVAVANDDWFGAFMLKGALGLQKAWAKAKRPVELHVYEGGGHGFGMQQLGTTSDAWFDDLTRWLALRAPTT
jgi:acetyl esterase/lipase